MARKTRVQEQLRDEPVAANAHILTEEEIRTKILHVLSIYPIISPTMLQGGLGPSWRPKRWRPVLDKLVAEGVVVQEEYPAMTPTERFNTYTKLYLHVNSDAAADFTARSGVSSV